MTRSLSLVILDCGLCGLNKCLALLRVGLSVLVVCANRRTGRGGHLRSFPDHITLFFGYLSCCSIQRNDELVEWNKKV